MLKLISVKRLIDDYACWVLQKAAFKGRGGSPPFSTLEPDDERHDRGIPGLVLVPANSKNHSIGKVAGGKHRSLFQTREENERDRCQLGNTT